MPAGTPHFPDPGIQHGPFKVLPRTDGLWAVLDTRRAPGEQSLKAFRKKETAEQAAMKWHQEGR